MKIYRFAPSPTGFLHVGGARTAIFNWLLARHNKGKFLLRVEDTDFERSSTEYTQQILNSLKWLGLDWDGDPVFQSQRKKRHIEVVNNLLNSNGAYRCFCSPESLNQKRKIAERNKAEYIYDGTCRSLSADEITKKLKQGDRYAVRLKTFSGQTQYDDEILGEITIDNKEIGDFIILRSDGAPVYQLAVVVDDYDMGVTNIVRGADHVSNTPKQIMIYEAMDWMVPSFAHLPLILGADKKRLSKRHGATSVEEFRNNGYLPEALFNYLCLLGWAPGDDREILDKDELIRLFTIKRVNKGNAVFDEQKLTWMNGQYISKFDAISLLKLTPTYGDEVNRLSSPDKNALTDLADLIKYRAQTVKEFEKGIEFFFRTPESYNEKGIKKYFLVDSVPQMLSLAQDALTNLADFSLENIERTVRQLAEENNLSAGKLIHPLRLALTGDIASPGIFEIIKILGKTRVNDRINRALDFIRKMPLSTNNN